MKVVSKLAAAPSVERILSSYRRFASPAIALAPVTVGMVVAVEPVNVAPALTADHSGIAAPCFKKCPFVPAPSPAKNPDLFR